MAEDIVTQTEQEALFTAHEKRSAPAQEGEAIVGTIEDLWHLAKRHFTGPAFTVRPISSNPTFKFFDICHSQGESYATLQVLANHGDGNFCLHHDAIGREVNQSSGYYHKKNAPYREVTARLGIFRGNPYKIFRGNTTPEI